MEEMNNQNRNNRAWILLCASLLAASGCGSSTAETTASTAVATAAAETTQATTAETGTYTDLDLLDLDGWWVRPEGYVSIGISLLDYFYVDSDTGTWTGYHDYGQENGMGGDVWIEDGCLVLTGASEMKKPPFRFLMSTRWLMTTALPISSGQMIPASPAMLRNPESPVSGSPTVTHLLTHIMCYTGISAVKSA